MWIPFMQGFGLGGGLIMCIGAQSAFVFTQGLHRNHHHIVVILCFVSDAVLISLGLAGMGSALRGGQGALLWMTWLGAVFLFFYGLRSFLSARKASGLQERSAAPLGLGATILSTLAVTYLNPQAYLDTLVLLGSVGGKYPLTPRLFFGAGALSASLIWFVSLGFGAHLFRPVFQNPKAWAVLDVLVGLCMWTVAGSLLAPMLFA